MPFRSQREKKEKRSRRRFRVAGKFVEGLGGIGSGGWPPGEAAKGEADKKEEGKPVEHVFINVEGGIRTLPFLGLSIGAFM